jgi:acyl-CoA oxidase
MLIHCSLSFVVRNFMEGINSLESQPQYSELYPVFQILFTLFCSHQLYRDSADFVRFGILQNEDLNEIEDKILIPCLKQVRGYAIGLVDGFDISDRILNSALGRYDGQVYKALYEWQKMEPLNKSDVVDGYQEFIRPIIKQEHRRPKL